jgi:NADH:ubiquinone oxidoreductase subunit F (NADH-binding)
MVIEVAVAVSLATGFALGYLYGKRAVTAAKAELDKVIVEAEKLGKLGIAEVFGKLKAKL